MQAAGKVGNGNTTDQDEHHAVKDEDHAGDNLTV